MSSRLRDETDDTFLTRIAGELEQLQDAVGSSLDRSRFDTPKKIRAHMLLVSEWITKNHEVIGEYRRRFVDPS
jgi:hypothetical protein